LQERVIERVGGRAEIPVDVRVVAATHADLTILLQQGKFRQDLYYRLSEVSVHIPPVRERESDALLLARVFLDRFAVQQGRLLKGFTPEALSAIEGYGWPGNVREIENRVKRAVVMAEGPRVSAEDLELSPQEAALELNLRQVREAAERQAVLRALQFYPGNLSQVAERLGISRPTLYDLLNKYGLK
jgi:two-component system NtrC family response regulator